CALLFGALAGGGANAQSIVQPPLANVIDANGVNLTTGKFNLPGLDVGIGSGQSGLSRVTQGDSDNLSGILSTSTTTAQFVLPPATANDILFYVTASYGGVSHRFLLAHYYPPSNTWNYSAYPLPELGGGSAVLTCDGAQSDVISNRSGSCTLILEDGTRVLYDRSLSSGASFGPMTSVTKPNGEVITFNYYTVTTNGVTTAKAVNTVNSSLGWALKYTVDANYAVTGVTAVNTSAVRCDAVVCSPGGSYPTVTKSVNGATTTLSRNGVNMLSYSVSGGVTTLTSPNGVSKTINTYTSGSFNGRVSSVVAGGQTWGYAYSSDGNTGETTTTVTEPNGKTHKIVISYNSTIKSTTDEAGRTTTYLYDSNFHLVKTISPDGNALTGGFTAIAYDSIGRVTSQQVVAKGGASNGVPNASASLVTSYAYANCDGTNDSWCRKPTSVTNENGVTTSYTYDNASGQVATMMLPAPSSGGARPKVTYSFTNYSPQNYDVPGYEGSLHTVLNPIRLVTGISTCRTADNGNCVNGADEKQTLISYAGSNNLLATSTTVKIGDGSYPQTTTATYDNNGHVIVADGPKSGAVDETYTFYDTLGRVQGAVGVDPDGASGSRHRQASH
ncbi:MAG TPA: hypothetical protein VN039_08250, partial [Nitrospira sp.]|nr:hypothetical protein [Nitrospira sp.]